MISPLLKIDNLKVKVEGKLVISDFQLEIIPGQVIALMGANGSGKSSLAMTLMGHTSYDVQHAEKTIIEFDGQDLLKMSTDERARKGLCVAWQNPLPLPGVSIFSFCKAIYETHGNKVNELVQFKKKLESLTVKVGLPKEYISRGVNEGFSGGERKRLELLQILLLQPKLVILDEIDSGLDVGGVKIVINLVNEMKKSGTAFILITHNKKLLDEILVDKICELKYGRLSTGV